VGKNQCLICGLARRRSRGKHLLLVILNPAALRALWRRYPGALDGTADQ
jgi:hypothetical protein